MTTTKNTVKFYDMTQENRSAPKLPSQRGIVEYWHIGDGIYVARDNYTSAEFEPMVGRDMRTQAYNALGRQPGDIIAEILGGAQ